MKTPHKHAELIKAWADGAEIEYWRNPYGWENCAFNQPAWGDDAKYRIKPEPKPDLNFYYHIDKETHFSSFLTMPYYLNLKLTFDGETGKLKTAEVIG
jgi:hypothetical protein